MYFTGKKSDLLFCNWKYFILFLKQKEKKATSVTENPPQWLGNSYVSSTTCDLYLRTH